MHAHDMFSYFVLFVLSGLQGNIPFYRQWALPMRQFVTLNISSKTGTAQVKNLVSQSRCYSTGKSGGNGNGKSIIQRFKETYKEHGKILIMIHIATSIVWFSVFYTAAWL